MNVNKTFFESLPLENSRKKATTFAFSKIVMQQKSEVERKKWTRREGRMKEKKNGKEGC